MKSKLRKITIDESDYLYSVNETYIGKDACKLVINIYLAGYKQTPLTIEFITADDFYMGQPLTSSVCMKNNKTGTVDKVNLHEPKYVRELILLGINKGWNGENNVDKQDGLQYLIELGYEVECLLSKNR